MHLNVTGLFKTYANNEITVGTKEQEPNAEELFTAPQSDAVHNVIHQFLAEFKAREPVWEYPFSA